MNLTVLKSLNNKLIIVSIFLVSHLLFIKTSHINNNEIVLNHISLNSPNVHYSPNHIHTSNNLNFGHESNQIFSTDHFDLNQFSQEKTYSNLSVFLDGTSSNLWILANYYDKESNTFANDVFLSKNNRKSHFEMFNQRPEFREFTISNMFTFVQV
jgi:hypothetical protein